MVIDIKMCRFENVPWGFRLVGGSDFEFPLTVVKVTEGSIAENAGLMVGDVIVRINDTAATPLTHDETNKMIKSCGNVFYFGVKRENEEKYTTPKAFPVIEHISQKSFLEPKACNIPTTVLVEQSKMNEDTKTYDEEYLSDLEERSCSVNSEETDRKLVEEEIAAVLSGESEVLKDHNKIGIFPKPGVCMSSDVLRTLNEDAIKTKAEKEKENRKWTTFLQKPDRPIPKSKQQIEAEKRASNAYKVTIVRGLSRSVSPAPPTILAAEVQLSKEPTPPPVFEIELDQEPESEAETPTPIDSEVPNLVETNEGANEENEQEELEKTDKEKEIIPEQKEAEGTDKVTSIEAIDNNPAETNEVDELKIEVFEKTEEELALEQQLANVQKQLAALSTLPSTIQSTLDSVTKQLADLLPTFKLQQEKPRRLSGSVARELNSNVQDEDRGNDENKDIIQNDTEVEKCHESVGNGSTNTISQQELEQREDNKANEQIANDSNEARDTIDKNLIKQQEAGTKYSGSINEETIQMEEEQKLKKQKIEVWNRLCNGENISRSVFRVNFMKYQKPEKKIDLNRSEVYKVIHHLDRQPVRGIEVRPSVVPAEVDIRKALHS